AFRSKNILGPYESKIVMDRGNTPINGPHQGGWVDTPDGKEDWFIHFQEILPYGRIVHLQPMTWQNDWPVIGDDPKNTGRGQPVLSFKKPNVGKQFPVAIPQTSDNFDSDTLGLQWQWWADWKPEWYELHPKGNGELQLNAVALSKDTPLYN